MPKETGPLNKLFSEHESINHLVAVASNEMTDINTFFRLQIESFDWSQASINKLLVKQKDLEHTLNTLEKTMQTHFAFEERTLPQLIGNLLTEGLIIEHQEIIRGFNKVRSALAESVSGGLTQPQLLVRKATLQQALEKLTGTIEAHARNEDTMLKLLQKATKGKPID